MLSSKNDFTEFVLPAAVIDGVEFPEVSRILYDDMILAERQLNGLVNSGVCGPHGKPLICVLPDGSHSFFATMEEAEDWAASKGEAGIHYVTDLLPTQE
ncbi:hypothetical protein SH449x_000203 [Pirellulaceae bacterium SH449]